MGRVAACIDVVYSASGFHGSFVITVSACSENPAGTKFAYFQDESLHAKTFDVN